MAKGLVNESSLNSIGTAINVLNGTEGTYSPSEMGEAIIDAIPTETASGNPIHITDAAAYPAESVVTALEPIQDLHGYDKPWPAGGGKNLFDKDAAVTGLLRADGTTATSYNNWATSAFIEIEGFTNIYISGVQDSVATTRGGAWYDSDKTFLSYFAISTVVEDGHLTVPPNAVYIRFSIVTTNLDTAQLEAGSTPTSYEPYSNICPISGHTGVELTRTGKNLVNIPDKTLSASGFVCNNNAIDLKAGTYTLSWKFVATGSELDVAVSFKDYKQSVISSTYYVSAFMEKLTVTIPIDAKFISMYSAPSGTYSEIQIERDSTATSYEPYTPETHTQTFPQEQSPVYGGEVDWVNGMLRVTKVNIASYNGETLPSVWISDRDVYTEGTTPSIGAQVVYELATPLEIPFTPEIITLLKGENNIWTDSGTSEIEYKVDLNSYIQKLIDEASAQASLSMSPLSLGKSAIEPESETEDEAEEKPTELLVEEDTEVEPTEKEPDTLGKEGGDTV